MTKKIFSIKHFWLLKNNYFEVRCTRRALVEAQLEGWGLMWLNLDLNGAIKDDQKSMSVINRVSNFTMSRDMQNVTFFNIVLF